jgi:hypothetical protein
MPLALNFSDIWFWLQLHSKDIILASLMAILIFRSVGRFRKNIAAKAKAKAAALEKAKGSGSTASVSEVKKVVSPPQTITGVDAVLGSWEYTGQVLNDQRHGNGICIWKGTAAAAAAEEEVVGQNGGGGGGGGGSNMLTASSSFEGQWSNGLPSGFGRHKSSDGTVFIGSFSAGQRHGKGKLQLVGTGTDGKAAGEAREVEFTHGKQTQGDAIKR